MACRLAGGPLLPLEAIHKLRHIEAVRCAAASCRGCGCSVAERPLNALEQLRSIILADQAAPRHATLASAGVAL